MYNIYDSINTADSDNYRVGYDDNGTIDPTKASFYYAFADDPRFTDAYYTPTGLNATQGNFCEIDLTWTAPSDTNGMTGYYIYRNDMGNTPIGSVPIGTTSLRGHHRRSRRELHLHSCRLQRRLQQHWDLGPVLAGHNSESADLRRHHQQ